VTASCLWACGELIGATTDTPTGPDAAADAAADANAATDGSDEDALFLEGGGDGGYTGCLGALACTRTVFVTSTSFTPGGGIAMADKACQDAADASIMSSVRGKKFLAWLSVAANDAATRLPHGTMPYVLPDSEVVALSWTALTAPPLVHPIDLDENASLASVGYIWTGTAFDGTATTTDCIGWTGTSDIATIGAPGVATAAWTAYSTNMCSQIGNGLYCFEY
jgi:hypothetical protein